MFKWLGMCLLVFCLFGCSDNSDNEGSSSTLFPTPPIVEQEPEKPQQPIIHVDVIDPPIQQPVVEAEPEVEKEEAVEEEKEEVDQELAEKPEEPKDNTHPKFVDSTVWHGDVGIALDTNQFIFTFDENVASAIIRLIDITQGKRTNMEWEHFIRDKQVVLLKVEDSLELRPGRAYTIGISVADKERNWHPDSIITFVTEMKE